MDDMVGIHRSGNFKSIDSASIDYQLLGMPDVVWEKEWTRLSDLLRPKLPARSKKRMQVRMLRTMNFKREG